MIWQNPTSWSSETTDGAWYVERSGKVWNLFKMRGRDKGAQGSFETLALAQEAAA